MKAPRILIVTYNWPPRNAIGTHRPYAWAKYWSEAGAQVTVLTATKYAFDAPLDLHLPTLGQLRVVEVPYGGGGHSFFARLVKNPKVMSYLKKLKALLSRTNIVNTDPRAVWRIAARPHIAKLAKDTDIIISTYGPEASHLIGYDGKMSNPSIKWVADYRDLWSQNHQRGWSDKFKQSRRSLEEATVGKHADLVTAVSKDMITKLGEFCEGDLFLVPNGFDLDEDKLRRNIGRIAPRPSKPFRIVYTGIVYSKYRDPTPLLEALARMVERGELAHGEVVIEFYGSRVEPIIQLMKNPRFRPFLRTLGHVDRDAVLRIQSEADLLLLLESSEEEARGVLTGKVFEYMSAGRPILCIGSRPNFEIGLLLQATGTGIVPDASDVESIASLIRAQVHGNGSPTWFAPKMGEIMNYTRKRQALSLLERMASLD